MGMRKWGGGSSGKRKGVAQAFGNYRVLWVAHGKRQDSGSCWEVPAEQPALGPGLRDSRGGTLRIRDTSCLSGAKDLELVGI